MADTHSDSGDARWTVKDRLCVAVPVAMLTTIGWASLFLFLNNQVPWYRELIEDHGIEIRDLYRPMFDAAELMWRHTGAAVGVFAALAVATLVLVTWLARRRARFALLLLATLGFAAFAFLIFSVWLGSDRHLVARVLGNMDLMEATH
jgi:hypothetical protein